MTYMERIIECVPNFSEGSIWHLYLNDDEVSVNPTAFPHEGYSVRCVKDIEGQKLK